MSSVAQAEATSATIATETRNASLPVREFTRFFFPLLRPYWKELFLAAVAVVIGSSVRVLQPWPLKFVIDRVLSDAHHSRIPLIGTWLDRATLTPTEIIYGG